MSALHRVLGPELYENHLVYVDDVLVPGKDFDEHMEYLDLVFQKNRRYRFDVKLKEMPIYDIFSCVPWFHPNSDWTQMSRVWNN